MDLNRRTFGTAVGASLTAIVAGCSALNDDQEEDDGEPGRHGGNRTENGSISNSVALSEEAERHLTVADHEFVPANGSDQCSVRARLENQGDDPVTVDVGAQLLDDGENVVGETVRNGEEGPAPGESREYTLEFDGCADAAKYNLGINNLTVEDSTGEDDDDENDDGQDDRPGGDRVVTEDTDDDVATDGVIVVRSGVKVDGGIDAGGDAILEQDAEVAAVTAGGNVSTDEDVKVGGGIDADGDVALGEDTDVDGEVISTAVLTAAEGVDLNGGVDVGGDVVLDDDIDVDGDVIAGGSVTTGDSVKVDGNVVAEDTVELGEDNRVSGDVEGSSIETGDGTEVEGDETETEDDGGGWGGGDWWGAAGR